MATGLSCTDFGAGHRTGGSTGRHQARAIELLKQPDWHDFGPAFASGQLARRHSIQAGKETVRAWVVAAGLWKARSRKLGEAYFRRPRRSG